MEKYLARLDIEAADGIAKIKTYRPDLRLEADLAEEIARMYGYDNIKTTLSAGAPTAGKKTRGQIITDRIKEILTAQGLSEAMTFSFESPKVFDLLCLPQDNPARNAVRILNPQGEDFSIMRTSLLNGILRSLALNYARRNKIVWIFEASNIYLPKNLPLTELPNEIPTLTVGMYGDADFYKIKGCVENLFDELGIKNYDFEREKNLPFMHPGRSARIFIGGTETGYIGELHPNVTENYEIGTRVYICSVNINILKEKTIFERLYKPLAKFPGINRDIAVVLDNNIMVKEIEKLIIKNGGNYLESVTLFDIYTGDRIGEGLKSAAFNMVFRSGERTLKESEIEDDIQHIIKALKDELGANLRS
jgi:phenylalanyl-tRNA synthetase beta chain